MVGSGDIALIDQASGARATLLIPAAALPRGSRVSLAAVENSALLVSKLPRGQSYVVSFAVSWVAPDGTSPTANAPLILTITDPSINSDDMVYSVAPGGLKSTAGVVTAKGKVVITFTTDPDFLLVHVPQLASVAGYGALSSSGVQVSIGCSRGAPCTGTGSLVVAAKSGAGLHNLVFAQGAFVINAGQTKDVTFTITSQGRNFVFPHTGKGVAGTLTVTLVGGRKGVYQVVLP
jgi:hypothetical protein